jgi:hypothetical protein
MACSALVGMVALVIDSDSDSDRAGATSSSVSVKNAQVSKC